MTRGPFLLLLLLAAPTRVAAQVTKFDRQRAHIMLDVVREDIRKHYFDTTYGGIDLDAVFDTAGARVDRSTALSQLIGAIAQATLELNDSHTGFLPPGLVYRADYGWQLRFVGDTCRFFQLDKGSDAEAKGVHVGDALLGIEGFRPSRENLFRLQYLLYLVQPRAAVRLILQSPGAEPRQVDIATKVIERRRIVDPRNSFDLGELIREGESEWEEEAPRWSEAGDKVVVWRPHHFYAYDSWVDDLLKSARKHQGLVLDLRGNHGGAVHSLLKLLGGFYAEDVTVCDQVERQKHEPMVAKGKGDNRVQGAIVVLVDAESASASEMFARTIQLTGRGKVLGDRTAGAVRESMGYIHSVGTQTMAFYGTQVTIADLVMPDGGRLEQVGVSPDEVILPTGADLRDKRDPVLAKALALLGVSMTAEQAGRLTWESDK